MRDQRIEAAINLLRYDSINGVTVTSERVRTAALFCQADPDVLANIVRVDREPLAGLVTF